MGTSVEPQPVAPNPAGSTEIVEASLLAQENHLLTIVRQYMAQAEVEQVSLALQLAQDTCKDLHDSLSPTSIPPLEHALAVATILADMHIDAVGVAAGLLFEAIDAERLALERVENILGPSVARVLGSMLRLNILERKKQAGAILARSDVEGESSREQKKRRVRENLRRLQAETVRKMFFAMAEDPRVVLLKLAYRLHAMRLIQAASYPVDHQDMLTMAQETREIYAPLAGRLGMARVESELEDLAFAILEPEKYAWIRNQVELESKQWRSYVDRVYAILREEMAKLGLHAEVSGRVKHLYSFYQKLKRTAGGGERLEDLQAADFSQIHDLIAFRILVESTPDCYLTLGHVHSLWKPKEGRIKDFIANPKPNGYRALHTTVFCLDNQLVEIQIRTRAMHEMAEYGVAMHWHYKDVGDHASASAKELLTWLRQLADWQRDLRSFATSDTEFIEAVKDDIFQEQIFVFTPKGEVKDLPIGSTPLDFAYRVHSKIGDRCAGARVTTEHGADRLVTRMVPLDYELRSGDIVDIMTNRTAHPTRDWLNFARTTAARSKIRRYLKVHERDINIQIGRERLERELKMMNARDDDVLTEENQSWLAGEFHQAAFEDVLAAIGSDEIRPHAAAVKLVDRWQQLREQREKKDEKDDEAPLPLPVTPKQVPVARLQVAGVSGLLTMLANCCCPLPGDEIVGFISRGKGAIVHRADCKNIDRYRQRERERLVNVSWTSMAQQHYQAPIIITARDRSGLIRDIAAVVSEAGVNMTAVNSNVSVGKQVVLINATLEIDSLDQMQRLFARIEKVRNVQHVERDLGKGRQT
jgi:guanosine-3',5'-bis(diphosphate) 3'-pyrophosphohydrolase